MITSSAILGSAPASSKNLTMSVKPLSTASIKMDGPEGLIKFTPAPDYIIENIYKVQAAIERTVMCSHDNKFYRNRKAIELGNNKLSQEIIGPEPVAACISRNAHSMPS